MVERDLSKTRAERIGTGVLSPRLAVLCHPTADRIGPGGIGCPLALRGWCGKKRQQTRMKRERGGGENEQEVRGGKSRKEKRKNDRFVGGR